MASRTRRRPATRIGLVGLAAVAVLLVPLQAFAEPTLSDRETARSLMEDGDAKREKNDLKGALKSYEGADAIMHVPTTGLEVGRTQATLGMLLEARETLSRVAKLPARAGEPPPFEKARRAAEQLSAEIAARIPSITVSVSGIESGQTPQIVFDGETVPPAAAFAARKVNPGVHTIVVRAGGSERKEDISVAEREQKTVPFDFAKSAATPPTPAPPPQTPDHAADADKGGGGASTGKILMYGGFALGAVGIGVGTVTGLMSISKVNDIKKSCVDNHCPPQKQSDIDSAKSLGTVSTVAFIAGGVGVGVGVIGLLMSRKSETTEQAEQGSRPVRVHADVGPSWIGVSGAFY